jgi:hypothetical protein
MCTPASRAWLRGGIVTPTRRELTGNGEAHGRQERG